MSPFLAGQKPCSFCHIPYSKEDAPFKMNLALCQVCGKKVVPEVLLATVDPPPGVRSLSLPARHVRRSQTTFLDPNHWPRQADRGESLPFEEESSRRSQRCHRQRRSPVFGIRPAQTVD